MTRAVTYCRCSTEDESQQDALQQQAAEARLSAGQQGWILVDEYIEAKSGTTTARRNEYNRLYEELQADKFDIVVIKSQDRLMRNTKDWYLFIDRMVTNGKKLFMYLEGKFYSADDSLITGIKAILAEEYSKELSKKINNAHCYRQRKGVTFILPPQTYGLKRNPDGAIVLVMEEAEAIRIMFFLCKSMGCISIQHYLEENGVRDRNGKPFKEQAIRRIIRNPIRCGTVIQNKKHFDFQTKKTVKMPKEQWIIHKNAVPAAVSEQEWQDANNAMDKRKEERNLNKKHPKGKNQGKYQLSGKIRCGECGRPYYRRYRKGYKNKKLIVEWKCQRYIQNGRNKTELRGDKGRKTELPPGQGCDNIHLDEERLFQLLETVCEWNYDEMEMNYVEIADKMILILSEVLVPNDLTRQITRLKKDKVRYGQQSNKLLDKLLEEVISDKDYTEKELELQQKILTCNQQIEKLKDSENAQLAVEQRLKTIRKRLEENAVRQAALAEMIDSIEEINVFPAKLILVYHPKKVQGGESPVLDSTENVPKQMGEKVQIEVPLDTDFLYSTRKEAENQRIIAYMCENCQITARIIAEKEGISISAANARIRRLRRQGKVYFEGQGGHGRWKVCEEKQE